MTCARCAWQAGSKPEEPHIKVSLPLKVQDLDFRCCCTLQILFKSAWSLSLHHGMIMRAKTLESHGGQVRAQPAVRLHRNMHDILAFSLHTPILPQLFACTWKTLLKAGLGPKHAAGESALKPLLAKHAL